MNGCCLGILLLVISPRLLLFVAWLVTHWYDAFDSRLVALLGWLFLPYTSLAWMYAFFHNGGRLEGGYLILFILAILFDLGVFSGSHRSIKSSSETGPVGEDSAG